MNFELQGSIQVVVFVIVFIGTCIAGPLFIPLLRRLKFGQTVRYDGPQTHLKKTGTPTMGGIIFLLPILLAGLFLAKDYPQVFPLVMVTIGFGAIGFLDDYIKVVKKRKDGLSVRQKTVGLLLVSTLFAVYMAYGTHVGTDVFIPFVGTINSIWFFIPFSIFVLYALTNAVNLTDGLDGLLGGITLIIMVFFTIVAMTRSQWDDIKVFSAMVAGGCLGFLFFNLHPAKVFMGDTGSLALGGAVTGIILMLKMPFIILIVGAIYVLEALSVVIQVTSFKLRGKRVFKMAPIHHHFELLGWKETKVVYVFWTVTLVLCMIGLVLIKYFS